MGGMDCVASGRKQFQCGHSTLDCRQLGREDGQSDARDGTTIVVLSRHYMDAMFTQPEWADAFRRDPTGDKDLLIPVRVESVEPAGILAQIVYVDLVEKNEAEALELLLRRAGRARQTKVAPPIPGGDAKKQVAHSVTARPVYPAAAEDQQQFLQARDAIVRWRGLYSGKLETLRVAGERAELGRRNFPQNSTTRSAKSSASPKKLPRILVPCQSERWSLPDHTVSACTPPFSGETPSAT